MDKRHILSLCCLVILGFPTPVFSTTSCNPGASLYSGYCFIASRASQKWAEASGICLGYGCTLVYPTTSAEKTAIIEFLTAESGNGAATSDFWLGLVDNMEKGRWWDTAVQVEVSNSDISWASGFPTGQTNKNCAYAADTSLNIADDNCDSQRQFVCECPTT